MGQSASSEISKLTQPNFSIEDYSGEWYEIARITPYLRSSCDNGITNFNVLTPSNVKVPLNQLDIQIIKSCYVDKRLTSQDKGQVWIPDPNVPSKMKIKFGYISSTIDYWVYATDYKRYSLVGSPGGDLLWILSRQSAMSFCLFDNLRRKARDLGFNIKHENLRIDDDVLYACTHEEYQEAKGNIHEEVAPAPLSVPQRVPAPPPVKQGQQEQQVQGRQVQGQPPALFPDGLGQQVPAIRG